MADRPSIISPRELQDALAVLTYELDDPGGSAEAYEAALEQLEPDMASLARLRLGHLWAASGRYDNAVAAYQAAVDAGGPYKTEAALRLGNLLFEQASWDKAERAYRSAASGTGERATEAALRLGNLLFEQGQYGDAAVAYERVTNDEYPHWSHVAERMLQDMSRQRPTNSALTEPTDSTLPGSSEPAFLERLRSDAEWDGVVLIVYPERGTFWARLVRTDDVGADEEAEFDLSEVPAGQRDAIMPGALIEVRTGLLDEQHTIIRWSSMGVRELAPPTSGERAAARVLANKIADVF